MLKSPGIGYARSSPADTASNKATATRSVNSLFKLFFAPLKRAYIERVPKLAEEDDPGQVQASGSANDALQEKKTNLKIGVGAQPWAQISAPLP